MKNKLHIVFFGDSICVGEGLSVHEGWVPRLSQDCQKLNNTKRYKDFNIIVRNSSISGDTTRTALMRMPYHIQNAPSNIVIIQFGLNDCNRWDTEYGINRVSEGSFYHNLFEMVGRATVSGTKKVYMLTNHPTAKHRGYNDRVLSYNNRIRRVASTYVDNVVKLIDVEKEFSRKGVRGVLPDGIHLNKQGHKVYYSVVRQALLKGIRNELR